MSLEGLTNLSLVQIIIENTNVMMGNNELMVGNEGHQWTIG